MNGAKRSNACAGVNPVDWKCREGWLSRFFEYKFPFVLGFAGAGIVSAVGPNVTDSRCPTGATHTPPAQSHSGNYSLFHIGRG